MRYRKEFEEVFANDVDPLEDTFDINEKTGEYLDPYDQALYRGFVAGIESGIKKKEPTLLEQVKEWRNSNISDEELLNNIAENLEAKPKEPNIDIKGKKYFQINNTGYLKYRYIDLYLINGSEILGVKSLEIGWNPIIISGWRPAIMED